MSETNTHPTHLDPSELGTKEYWDNYYQNDLDQSATTAEEEDEDAHDVPADPADLESWFDDVGAPTKVLEYLTSEDFPLSPNNLDVEEGRFPRVLDLGTGNGSMLFMLRLAGMYEGPMVGVDYSQQSINLARKLWSQYSAQLQQQIKDGDDASWRSEIRFEKVDLIREDPREEEWWPQNGFDIVLDKGTFDAISLSLETIQDEAGRDRRICELYPKKIVDMIAPGGYLLITSCNWTEDEVMRWFLENDEVRGRLELFGKIQYPVYEFGGHTGSGVASVCFRRTSTTS